MLMGMEDHHFYEWSPKLYTIFPLNIIIHVMGVDHINNCYVLEKVTFWDDNNEARF